MIKNIPSLLISCALAASTAAAESAKPNIILIISDDQGFTDYGFMGHEIVKTPHLDRMATESLLYTRGYVMPVCAPSLASLLTGQVPSGHGITGNDLAKNAPQATTGSRDPLMHQLLGNSLMLPRALTRSRNPDLQPESCRLRLFGWSFLQEISFQRFQSC